MNKLGRRIRGVGGNQAAAMAETTPAQGPLPVGTAATPMVMPVSAVTYSPVQDYPWGTATYQDLQPVYSPDGALIAAYDNGSWGNVRAAGRASPAHQ